MRGNSWHIPEEKTTNMLTVVDLCTARSAQRAQHRECAVPARLEQGASARSVDATHTDEHQISVGIQECRMAAITNLSVGQFGDNRLRQTPSVTPQSLLAHITSGTHNCLHSRHGFCSHGRMAIWNSKEQKSLVRRENSRVAESTILSAKLLLTRCWKQPTTWPGGIWEEKDVIHKPNNSCSQAGKIASQV